MTKEQKLEACSMRFDGISIQEIADNFGVTREYIRKITPKISTKSVRSKNLELYIYPNISRWMQKNRVCASKLSKMIGTSASTVTNMLNGSVSTTKRIIDKVLEVTGMTYEEAFCVSNENSSQPLQKEEAT